MSEDMPRPAMSSRLLVAVWNMEHTQGWAALDRLSYDLALLTDASLPRDRASAWMPLQTLGRDRKHRSWASAILSPHKITPVIDARASFAGSTRDVPFTCSRHGAWVAATVEASGWPVITAVSLYGLMDEMSDASVHRSLSEISPIFDDARYSTHVLVGGDLNTAPSGQDPDGSSTPGTRMSWIDFRRTGWWTVSVRNASWVGWRVALAKATRVHTYVRQTNHTILRTSSIGIQV